MIAENGKRNERERDKPRFGRLRGGGVKKTEKLGERSATFWALMGDQRRGRHNNIKNCQIDK